MFAIIAVVLVAAVYIALGGWMYHQLFPEQSLGKLIVMMGICYFGSFFQVLFNGIMPSLPLTADQFWIFTLVFYLGITFVLTFGLRLTIDEPKLGILEGAVLSAGGNLALTILLCYPTFLAALSASNYLLKPHS